MILTNRGLSLAAIKPLFMKYMELSYVNGRLGAMKKPCVILDSAVNGKQQWAVARMDEERVD